MSLTIGTRLGPYDILSAIGAGGMGEVYRARDSRLKREIAIKVLPDRLASDPDRLARFEREAQLLASLNHPHIVTIHSIEQIETLRFLTMELVDGQPLDRLIPAKGMSIDRLLAIAVSVADACSAAHDEGIIHRDLKPANVMVDATGRVKVLDFGLAKLAGYTAYFDHYRRAEYAEALAVAEQINMPDYFTSHTALAAAHAQLDHVTAARSAAQEVLRLAPTFPEDGQLQLERFIFSQPQLVEHFIEGLRKAGLPMARRDRTEGVISKP